MDRRLIALAMLWCTVAAARPPCEEGKPPEWCAAKMVALRIETEARSLRIRVEEGGRIRWYAREWKGPLFVRADRQAGKGVLLSVALTETGQPVAEALLKKGQSLVLTPGRQVPKDFFGDPTHPVRFVAEE